MRQGKPAIQCRSRDELGGAKAQRRTVSMTSLVLGSALAFFSGVRSTNSFCRLPQVTGPLHLIRRARPLIVTCQRIIQASTLLKKPHMDRCAQSSRSNSCSCCVFVVVRISRSRFTDTITVHARLASEIFLSSLHACYFFRTNEGGKHRHLDRNNHARNVFSRS